MPSLFLSCTIKALISPAEIKVGHSEAAKQNLDSCLSVVFSEQTLSAHIYAKL